MLDKTRPEIRLEKSEQKWSKINTYNNNKCAIYHYCEDIAFDLCMNVMYLYVSVTRTKSNVLVLQHFTQVNVMYCKLEEALVKNQLH